MMIQGTMIAFTPMKKAPKRDGGQYDAWELVYRNPRNEVESIVKPAGGLQANPTLKAGLVSLVVGDSFTMLQEKNERGFWEPQSVEKGHRDVQEIEAPRMAGSRAAASPARGGRVLGSTYETAEERAKKQVIITRQASINAAINFLGIHSPEERSLEKALEVAKEFEKHYNKDLNKAAKKYLDIILSVEE